MQIFLFFLFGSVMIEAAVLTSKYSSALLGAKECSEGPSYWCQTFQTAKTCNAMKHCIETVWEHQVLPDDNSDICTLCKDMVKQARDQLQSNETQEELKEVFEGSCKLIPIKPISKECCKISDEFIPELVEALSSQMNPQVVCSVAGLCNSNLFTELTTQASKSQQKSSLDCAGCRYVSSLIESNFSKAKKNDVLNMFIEMCGKMGSFSDGCAAIMITYFNDLYSNLNARLKPNETCHIAGVCSPKYHIHADKVDLFSKATKNDDLPCELCEQLVQHLADILVSNTTEEEFQQVLLGICGQTKSFKNECVNIVREYYPIIYEFLSKELDGKVICRQIGICNKTSLANGKFDAPLYPLIPVNMESQIELLNDENINQKPKLHRVSLVKDEISIHSGSPALNVEIMQLPIERLTPLSMLPKNKEECEFCEYFLHYLQVEITDPMTEKQLKQLIERGCDKLPNSVSSQCKDFIETYGQAFVALLAQKIDPSQVCPSIGVCPGLTEKSLINDKEKPTCPLCLMVMETLTDELKDNKTEVNIRKTLENICNLLPKTVTKDCVQLVDTYFEEVIDMVIAEFTPQEVCSYMKMCSAPKDVIGGDINTNEIPDTLDDEKKDNNQCVLCEFIMSQLEKELQDKKTEEEIKNAVLKICHVLPATVRPQCSKFVEKYADLIIELLAASVDPKGLCTAMKLCPTPDVDILLKGDQIKKGINKCIVCESIMGALQGILEDENIELSLNEKLILSCQQLPKKMNFTCQDIIRQLAPQIERILSSIPAGPLVCHKLHLCQRSQKVALLGSKKCTWGPGYWCQDTNTATECNAVEHCQTKVWMTKLP